MLVIGQTPPPLHGQSIMYQHLLQGHFEKVAIRHIRMAFSASLQDIGRFQVAKLFHLLSIVSQVIGQAIRGHRDVLYYPPAGPAFVPFVRDIIILISTRWLFRATVFHFHAAGLAEFVAQQSRPFRWLAKKAYSGADPPSVPRMAPF